MKALKYLILFSGLLLAMILPYSCELEEANNNPNSPTEVPPNVLLPFNESRMARLMGSTPQVMAGIFMQYYEGIDNHPLQVQIYVLNEALYVDWDWNDYYDGPMINIVKMIESAETDGSYYYTGMGKIMMALCLGNISSMWGDVPYSEALNGAEIRSPRFDSQQSIYQKIQELLDEGIADLGETYEGFKPGSDDIIYGGNVYKWIQAAYALKARYYIHLTKRASDLGFDPSQKALETIGNAIRSSNDDMEYPFGYSASEYSPFYSFARLNYLIPNNTFTSLLSSKLDPRRNFYYKKRFGESSLEGSYFTSPASPVHMITYHELKMIEAEARLRLDENDPDAQTALQEGVRASLNKISEGTLDASAIDAYVNANAVLSGTFEEKLETIMVQKYIALFSSIEPWTDYRRTGYPVLTPNEGGNHNQNPGGAIPRRLAYPQTERLYNNNFPEVIPTLQDRFWWDME
jgi:hypothetical protein